jgi:hypothetical protein
MRTLEQRIKTDVGLTLGQHLVTLHHGARERLALIDIRPRGAVYVLPKPDEGDMYSCCARVKNDACPFDPKAGVIVWGARDPELMKRFDGTPVARIELNAKPLE